MEPHAIVAAWEGDTLSSTRRARVSPWRKAVSPDFSGSAGNIHIRSPFLGGGFGSKGMISGPQVLGVMAARMVGKPVKLVLRREQMFGPVGHRAPTRQTLRLGADDDGKLTALDHRTKTASSTFDDFFEPASDASIRFMRARPSPRRMKLFGSTPERRCSCAHRARRPARSRSKAPSTKWLTPAGWIRWPSGSRTMPRSSRSPASRSPQRRCATATRKAPSASAGSAARSHRARCEIETDCWSAGASAQRRFRR